MLYVIRPDCCGCIKDVGAVAPNSEAAGAAVPKRDGDGAAPNRDGEEAGAAPKSEGMDAPKPVAGAAPNARDAVTAGAGEVDPNMEGAAAAGAPPKENAVAGAAADANEKAGVDAAAGAPNADCAGAAPKAGAGVLNIDGAAVAPKEKDIVEGVIQRRGRAPLDIVDGDYSSGVLSAICDL